MPRESANMPGQNPEMILSTLYAAGNMDRLEREARRFLSMDADDVSAHYFLTLALGNMGRFSEAVKHLEFILKDDPDELRYHIAAISHYVQQERWSAARKHVEIALRLDPHSAEVHYFAAYVHVNCLRHKEAKVAIDQARQLNPHDADIVNLHIRIHSLEETSATDALKRLSEYENALLLDPENAWLHKSMGDVHAFDLGEPLVAQSHYREALRLKPNNRDFQKALFSAVAESNLVYRMFSIPSRALTRLWGVAKLLEHEPWRLIFLLFAIKFVAAYVVWLGMVTVLFWPGGKVYEWLLVNEIKRGSVTEKIGLRVWFWFRQWPTWARFGLFLLLNLALWGGLFLLLGIEPFSGYNFVGGFVCLHFAFVLLVWIYRKIRRYLAVRSMRVRSSQTIRQAT